ncbi:MAG: UDP-N-acetylglucosamine--LPS N-acetylglucosamine transferase [Pseudomonadota bacterium]
MRAKHAPKVMAIASAGGHWVQLMRLVPAWDGCNVIYVTTNPGFRKAVEAAATARTQDKPRFFSVAEANRWQKARLVLSFAQIAWVILTTWPDVIVTTGAAPGFFAVWIGKRLGMRTVWIDSIANAEEISLSGQKVGKHATLWLTQWEHLAQAEGPYYRGSVL